MRPDRLLHLDDNGMSVWQRQVGDRDLQEISRFSNDDSGLVEFDRWLDEQQDHVYCLLANAGHAKIDIDTLPRLTGLSGWRERRYLLNARLRKRFPSHLLQFATTLKSSMPGMASQYQQAAILYALDEELSPWLKKMRGSQLAAIYSPDLLWPRLLAAAGEPPAHCMLLCLHGAMFIQSLIVDDRCCFCRLTPVTYDDVTSSGARLASFCAAELPRLHEYLRNERWLPDGGRQLPVFILAHPDSADEISKALPPPSAIGQMQTGIVNAQLLAQKMHLPAVDNDDARLFLREIALNSAHYGPIGKQFAGNVERYQLLKLGWKHALRAAAVTVLFIGLSCTAALYAWSSNLHNSAVQQQLANKRLSGKLAELEKNLSALPLSATNFLRLRSQFNQWNKASASKGRLWHEALLVLQSYPSVQLQRIQWMQKQARGKGALNSSQRTTFLEIQGLLDQPNKQLMSTNTISNAKQDNIVDNSELTTPRERIFTSLRARLATLRSENGGKVELSIKQAPFDWNYDPATTREPVFVLRLHLSQDGDTS